MRITGSSSFSGNVSSIPTGELADASPVARNLSTPGAGVEFGQSGQSLSDLLTSADDTASSVASFFSPGGASANSDVGSFSDFSDISRSSSFSSVNSTASSEASDSANAPKADDAAFLDNSRFSSPEALERWAPMVAHLPPEQREQAAKELNRPIAAAWMAREDGPDAAKAMEFINDNPALKTAVDTAQGGTADGKITNKDLKTFAKNMEKAAKSADKDVENYQKDNPNADPQSLEMVRNAAVMRANMPLAQAADPHNELGVEGQTKVDDNVGADDLKNLAANNPGLSGALKQSCSTWSQAGFLGQLDEAGMKGRAKAAHSPDKLFNAKNLSEWIKKSAPTNGGQFASMLSDAATLNSVDGIDISKLNANVFDNPTAYTGAQKAAVMIKLQQTQQSVIAGRELRDTENTEQGLTDRIAKLQADPDVQAFLNDSVPKEERRLVSSDSALKDACVKQADSVNSGQALQTDMATADKAVNKHNPNPDYSSAISGLSAQLQLQHDLFPDTQVPNPRDVVSKNPQLESTIKDSYTNNFANGGALKQLLGQKKVDGEQAMQMMAGQKAAYDSVLSSDVTDSVKEDYANSTVRELQDSKKGRKLLEGKTDESHASALASELLAGGGPKMLRSVMGFMSVKDMLAHGDKLGAAQAIYDSTKYGAQAIKGGVDAGAKLLGREASVGLGRMAGQMVGRAVGMVAGEAAGMAAGMAVGASIPVIGWAIDGAMALGFGISMIIDAVKKHKAQKAFDHNVDPVLDQFGIAKAH
ncbi:MULTISPECIES: HrpF/NolX family T3SS translocon protein [Pseudomonas syringae group]|uniref:HrpK n=2 Tax=Pseudomonas syringae group TaxID=136849 RepID=I6LCM0_PSEVI|nr:MULTISPECIES: type III effector HrpK domain-containing protein [Pseudomonas syringae group]AAT96136.1 HrpK [Pseudomonas viridiflava]KPY37679.1 HrpK [Pseudomonas syringae pv. primulae]MBD8200674.1 type III effector HrpK [Pseudomonas viridiflava]TKJ68356.1 type III effector HrpK [Pseudomonas viridiflava]TKK32056.1 type III effector HrpK [Pseudomonas viridiflava]